MGENLEKIPDLQYVDSIPPSERTTNPFSCPAEEETHPIKSNPPIIDWEKRVVLETATAMIRYSPGSGQQYFT